MKLYVDKYRHDLSLNEGDWVYVKLQPYKQSSVEERTRDKLSKHYFGPYQIIKELRPVACEIATSPTFRIHPVFYVSLLKRYIGEVHYSPIPYPLILLTITLLYDHLLS